jgi:hypothetical protein
VQQKISKGIPKYEHQVKKMGSVSYIIKSLKEVMNNYMINIYCANFLTLLRYGIILCGGDNESNNV